MVSLVLKFINNLRKQSDSFDVKTVEPKALLNYVDPHFIGMQNLGRDSLHTANWKKSLHTAKVTLDSPIRHSVPTTNWLIYPGMPMARKTLRTLHKIAKGCKKAKLIHSQVLDILNELCWLNLYTNLSQREEGIHSAF